VGGAQPDAHVELVGLDVLNQAHERQLIEQVRGTQRNPIERRAIAAMRKIDAHADAIHLRNKEPAEACEAAAAFLQATVAGDARLVVCELRDAKTQGVKRGDALETIAERSQALPAHDEAGGAFRLRRQDVSSGAHQAPA